MVSFNMMYRYLTFFSIAVFALTNCSQSPSSPTLPPPGGNPKIFEAYSPNGNSRLAKGWTRGFDMSGVSFNMKQTCTLITPKHVVMARHFKRPVNSKVVFHDRNGKVCTRTIMRVKNCASDVAVGLLDLPVPSGYTAYPLPSSASNTQSLINAPIVVTDQNKHLFFHRVRAIGSSLSMKYDPKERYGWAKNLIVGDSGNPSFLISGNQLILAETHTSGGPGSGPYYGDQNVQNSIATAIKELDPAYSFRVKIIQ